MSGRHSKQDLERTPDDDILRKLEGHWDKSPTRALRWRKKVDVRELDCNGTPGWDGDRDDAERLVAAHAFELAQLQERLFAHGRSGGSRSVLLVLQGLDTAGKGGIVRHVVGLVDPQGVQHRAFGVPTAEEASHGYLWRIRNALPRPGYIGVFDRSHYEQVLVVRVDGLEPEETWRAHYEEINAFEAEVAAAGTVIVKVALLVSRDEQKARLRERLDRPEKHWKYNPGDLAARARFGDYLDAYQEMLEQTSTDVAAWHVVPADRKWFARLAVTELLLDALRSLDLGWPPADFDVAEQRRLLDET
ncbi:PPK2 family polyphosphate kinase [Xylanimonas ulmi]|uniref:PPK2 family polyphosphate:nucleotide phosphotransferase n=1 Tax=Xylanimonas ulmi TaxID=228973 RepID=A0A4Q7M360_9MICO|nr:PPK2 family polyphosphate kinase [Xylanibacterium ulmi]RZS61062.1 PPK2 family polyphosphate:nucleotide phosphotransferase [Xylanibacterium ulmi]